MLTVAAAICLVVALAIDVSRAGSLTASALWCAAAGIALLLLAAVFPRWPRQGNSTTDPQAQAPASDDTDDDSGNPRSDAGDE